MMIATTESVLHPYNNRLTPLYEAGLAGENFRPVGIAGCTDPRNSYAQAMDWFEGCLFVGMTRDTLALMKRPNRVIPPPKVEFWPVKCKVPEDPYLMRGQVLRFDPISDEWHIAYRSPMATVEEEYRTTDQAYVMRDVGYRGMAVMQGRSDAKPCLYAGSISASGSRILRCEDGINFTTTPSQLPGPSIRSLVACKERLFTAIVGKLRSAGNESADTRLWESRDPANGEWRPASEPGFGEPSNNSLYEMCEFNNHLYVATMNSIAGFQLWKSDLEGKPPYRWKKVLTGGAWRGFLNEFGISLCAFNGALYVGTGIAGGGYDRINRVGPAASELLRVYPDDSWDLLVGAVRATPDGVRAPLSGMGPGFDCFLNGYTWRMCAHQGWLYVSTFNAGVFRRFRPHQLGDIDKEQMAFYEKFIPYGDFDRYIDKFAGGHLWRTRDGEHFYHVNRDGFGNPYNYGIRTMSSSPLGLFVGTANPFGPDVGVKRNGKWQYEKNPRGGSEVWLGSRKTCRRNLIEEPKKSEAARYRRSIVQIGRQIDHYLYTAFMDDYYQTRGFHHIGYWKKSTTTGLQACRDLVALLVRLLPPAQGKVLDIACGRGGTTATLCEHLGNHRVEGIDRSMWNINMAMAKYPDVHFRMANPTRLDDEDDSIAAIFCFEGGLYLDTRRRFVKEAWRLLKPGGVLLMADRLANRDALRTQPHIYRTNYVRNLASYRRMFDSAGFNKVKIQDCGNRWLQRHADHASGFLRNHFRTGQIPEGQYSAAMAMLSRLMLLTQTYVLVGAKKSRSRQWNNKC